MAFQARYRLDTGEWTPWTQLTGSLDNAVRVANATLTLFRDLVHYEIRSGWTDEEAANDHAGEPRQS